MYDQKRSKTDLIKELNELRLANSQYKTEQENQSYKSQQSDMMLMEMITHSPVSIQVLDREGFSVMINDAHSKLFGVRPPPGYNMFRDTQLLEQGLADSFRRLQEGEAVFFPDTWYNPSLLDANFPDKLIWVKTLGFPLLKEKGTPKGYVVMHEDITELIRLENELKEKNENIRYLYDNFQARLEMQRKSIAVEIHDRLIQDLTAHKVKLAILKTRCTDQAMKEELKQEMVYVNAVIKSSRNILNSVWPAILDSQGLEVAIAAYLKKFSNKRRIAVVWDAEAASEISKEVAYPLYMIFQEAMVNIVKHARAKNVRISLKQENEQVHLMVSDDGRGFDEAKALNKKSFGLFMMKDLMNSLGGSFNISKGEPQGTIIDCVVPVKRDVK